MGLIFRRRVSLGRRLWANLSGSGVSLSGRRGPVTANSRGGISVSVADLAERLRAPSWLVELLRGVSYRGRWR